MNSTIQFINDMKDQYNMNDITVLQAIRDDPQHKFIMDTQDVSCSEAREIMCEAEEYLIDCIQDVA